MTGGPSLRRWGWVAMVALGLVAPFVVYPVFAMNVLCLALFASAFNLLLGYTGLLSFGHAAFLGSGAYAAGYAAKVAGLGPELSVVAGTAVATLLGAIFGGLAIRRSGIYFAMITLGFAQLVYFLVVQMPWTGGEDGLQGIPRGKALGLVSLAGSLKALTLQFATLSDVHWHQSGEVVLMTLLGGLGTVLGPSVGALLVVALANYLTDAGSWVTVITGGVFVVCVLAFRRGIVGEVRAIVVRSFIGVNKTVAR